jgi:hypothetical protein
VDQRHYLWFLISVTDGDCVIAHAVQRLRTLPVEERENVLSKLFLLYGGSPSKSSKEAISRGSAEDGAVDERVLGDEASTVLGLEARLDGVAAQVFDGCARAVEHGFAGGARGDGSKAIVRPR